MVNETKRPLKVFLCHASSDKPAVRDLYKRLIAEGVDAWLDQEKLLPGQDWHVEIPRAVKESDVVVICLSNKSIAKEGYVQKEIRFALDSADEKTEETIFLIPARLEDCPVPERLAHWQWVDLFEENGFLRLLLSLKLRADKVGAKIEPLGYETDHRPDRPINLLPDLREAIKSTTPSVRAGAARKLGQLLREDDKSLIRQASGMLKAMAKEDDSLHVRNLASTILKDHEATKIPRNIPQPSPPSLLERTRPFQPIARKETSNPSLIKKLPKEVQAALVQGFLGLIGVALTAYVTYKVGFARSEATPTPEVSPISSVAVSITSVITGTPSSSEITSQPINLPSLTNTTLPLFNTSVPPPTDIPILPTTPVPPFSTSTLTPTVVVPSKIPTYTLTPTPPLPTFTPFGTGADGNLIVPSGQTIYIDYIRSVISSTASRGQPNIVISDAANFAVDQEVLIIQMQGTGAGTYEFGRIASKSSNMLTLQSNLVNQYIIVGGISTAQVIRVPNYQSVLVQSGGILTAHDWDGNTGGIVVFRALTSTSVAGTIRVIGGNGVGTNTTGGGGGFGGGFRGGGAFRHGAGMSFSGEGTDGPSAQFTSANGNGAGGSYQNLGNVGGSGGSNGSLGLPGTKEHNEFTVGSVGLTSGSDSLAVMTLGGGGSGGSAENNNNDQIYGGGGGAGGGIVFIASRTITVTGGLSVNGGNGGNGVGASGGGGAGGSIYIKAETTMLGSALITVLGGSGGTTGQGGQGGNGGLGILVIQPTILSGTTNPSASSQQVNYFNLTGSSSNTLYVPDVIGAGNHLRYVLLYGQRGVNTKT